MIRFFILAFVAGYSLVPACFAELKPAEIAIVASEGSRESQALAKYYCRVRGVPEANICLVDVPSNEMLPREMWQWGVRPEIQKWITEHDPNQKLRCLVTVWGVPLKIGTAAADADSRMYQKFLQDERAHRVALLARIQQGLDRVAPKGELSRDAESADADDRLPSESDSDAKGGKPPERATATSEMTTDTPSGTAAGKPTPPNMTELEQLRLQLENSLQSAQARLGKLAAGEARNRGQIQMQQLAAAAGGVNVILQGLNQQVSTNANVAPALRSEFDVLRGRGTAYAEIRILLDQTPPSIERDALVLALLERLGGVLGSIEWLDEQLKVVGQNETSASFDSELALVMWPDEYQLLRWQPNYLRPGFDNSQLPKAYRTFMVARIDAPTLVLAKGLIDTAIKVEKEGLRGKVYIDGRGIGKLEDTNVTSGSYAEYDKALLITAKGIDELTDLDVVLDTTPQLFQPGQCPDAALYCGWYSLAKYVDAFDWKPGAVAYHLASSEASTLRDPASNVWCKKLLEDGVCATMGPVFEPYLGSFPRPNEFFAMLLQGDLTLVECFARTNPFNSWMMTLIGDPLYRPFKYRVSVPLPTETPTPSGAAPPDVSSTLPTG